MKVEYSNSLPSWIESPAPDIYTTGTYVCLDFETTSEEKGSPYNAANQLVLACWYTSWDGMWHYKWGDELEQQELLDDVDRADFIVAQNGKFELGWLDRCGIDLHDVLLYDTMLAEWVILGNRKLPLNLDSMLKRRGLEGKEDHVAGMLQLGINPLNVPRSLLQYYCFEDVRCTLELFQAQLKELEQKQLFHLVYSRCMLTPVLVDIEKTGVSLDKESVLQEWYVQSKKCEEAKATLENISREVGGEGSEATNFDSPKQLATLIYEKLGFEEVKDFKGNPIRTDTGARSTNADVLSRLRARNKLQKQFVAAYLAFSEASARLSKFLNFAKEVVEHHGGTFYGVFNQGNTGTHRLSSSGRTIIQQLPNGKSKKLTAQLQNMPREYKRLVRAKMDGWEVWDNDGSQLEFRVAGDLGHDHVALEEITNYVDIHSITAKALTEAGEPTDRQEAKSRCVPLYSKILTKKGWKGYDDVEVGELVLSFNHDKNLLEWQPLLEKVLYKNQPTCRLGFSHNWSAVSTPDHRWYGWKRTDHGSYKSYDKHIAESSSLSKEFRMAVSAPLMDRGSVDCADSDARIVGWIFTDGHIEISPLSGHTSQGKDGRKRGVIATIIQKKDKGKKDIEKCLEQSGVAYSARQDASGCLRYRLKSEDVRNVLVRCGLGLDNPRDCLEQWVLNISPSARKSFLEACILAEGTDHGFGVCKVAQNVGPVKEAIHLAAYLCGHDVRVSLVPKEKIARANFDHATMRLRNKGYINGAKLICSEDKTQDVWCPRTEHGTWVMRQGETITITGNTFRPLYGGTSGTPAEQEYCKFFQNKYKGIYETQKGWAYEVLKTGQLRTPYGMIFYWPGTKISRSGFISNTTAIFNYPVQGFATGEIIPIALFCLWHRLRVWPVRFTLTIHDSIVLEVGPDVDKEKLKELIAKAFTEDVYDYLEKCYGYKFVVPLGCGIKAGPRWGEGKEIQAQMFNSDRKILWREKK